MSDETFGPLARWRRESGVLVSEDDRAALDAIAGELGRTDTSSPRHRELLDSLLDIAARYSPDPRLPHD